MYLFTSIFKAFVYDKRNVAEVMISPSDKVENFVVTGENVGHQHFLLFPHFFQNPPFFWVIKSLFVKR